MLISSDDNIKRISAFHLFVSAIADAYAKHMHMQMQTQCRAVKISITTSYSTSVKFYSWSLTEVSIASPFCDLVHGRVSEA